MVDPAIAGMVRRGLFSRAYEGLLASHRLDLSETILFAEVQSFLGMSEQAADLVRGLMSQSLPDRQLVSRCTVILADEAWYRGDLDEGLLLCQKAYKAAVDSGAPAQACRTILHLLDRTCSIQGLDESRPLARAARQATIRCGDSHLSALAHLSFGRLEAKFGNVHTAGKHFVVAERLLEAEPNAWLQAALYIDHSGIISLAGDFEDAIELAHRGARIAQQIGWARGNLAAQANLASFYVATNRHKDALGVIELCLRDARLTPSYRVALIDTYAKAALACGEPEKALNEVASERIGNQSGQVQAWYELSALETRARLLNLLGRWHAAWQVCEMAIRKAEKASAGSLLNALRLERSEAAVGLRQLPTADDLDVDSSRADWPLRLLGMYHRTVGRALRLAGDDRRGISEELRGERLLIRSGDPEISQAPPSPAPQTADIDSAVALLELAGHPHILGREAFGLIAETGCARAVALVACDDDACRVLDAHGWTEAEALAAARAAAPDDFMPVGPHRTEEWAILARPTDVLEERCTLAAIRKLLATARSLDRYRRDEKQRAALWPAEALDGDPESIWVSEQSAELLAIARRLATAPVSILLTGETGTGKEMLARAIHRASERADKPFLPFNCTAVPRDMLESQLFGYRRGAFTGADAAFPGVIRGAGGGTLFLDEIGEVGLDVQPKLLRFLERHEIHPLGEPQPITVDVRVIAATNGHLEQLVAAGRFREDLLYRLNAVHLRIPPLRERREEIPPLVHHYLRRYGDEQHKGRLILGDETLEYLLLYAWPGNIRQLANEIRRMVALAEPDATLTPALLSPEIQASRRTIAVAPGQEPELRVRLDQPMPAAVDLLEQAMVRRALDRTHGRVEEAAHLLGISRKGLFLKRRRWGLPRVPVHSAFAE